MPRKIQKSLQNCVSKIKNQAPRVLFSPSGSKSWLVSGCKHVRTLSMAIGREDDESDSEGTGKTDAAATLADVDKFLYENFTSLFFREDNHSEVTATVKEAEDEDGRGRLPELSPERYTGSEKQSFKSSRFFVGTGSSRSLVEDTRLSRTNTETTATSGDRGGAGSSFSSLCSPEKCDKCGEAGEDGGGKKARLPEDCIAVLTYSRSPCDEFKRSMQEMVEARVRRYGGLDWSFMVELVTSYLEINDKDSHKFILSAFADIVVDLKEKSADVKLAFLSPQKK